LLKIVDDRRVATTSWRQYHLSLVVSQTSIVAMQHPLTGHTAAFRAASAAAICGSLRNSGTKPIENSVKISYSYHDAPRIMVLNQ
jgi:hypothetical protein